jgi:hypothetical protein
MAWNRSASPSVSPHFPPIVTHSHPQDPGKNLTVHSVSSEANRYANFIRKNSPNPNEFAQFAFNLLTRPDDHATKQVIPSCEFLHSLSLGMT